MRRFIPLLVGALLLAMVMPGAVAAERRRRRRSLSTRSPDVSRDTVGLTVRAGSAVEPRSPLSARRPRPSRILRHCSSWIRPSNASCRRIFPTWLPHSDLGPDVDRSPRFASMKSSRLVAQSRTGNLLGTCCRGRRLLTARGPLAGSPRSLPDPGDPAGV